jgi:hypothetical protein
MSIPRAVAAFALVLLAFSALAPGAGAATTNADFGVTLTGPPASKVGAPTTYTVAVANAGPDTESVKMRFAGGSGAVDTGTGEPVKTVSQTPTQGTCKNDGFGVTCRLGDVAPAATATVTIVLLPQQADVPSLDVQATIQPDKASTVDANPANDHAELVTRIPAPIKVQGVPGGCTSKKIVLRVRTKVGSAAGQTKLIVDGAVLAHGAKSKLTATIAPDDLKPGRHNLAVIVQSSDGPPLATLKAKFKTCG